MVTASQFADQAKTGGYIGIPYKTLDCQAFVERVLRDCGVVKNWRGSNDMWRNAVHDQTPLDSVADVPAGVLLFTIKHDGKEDNARYKDGINAAHVGIYCGGGLVVHSTTGGVQWDEICSPRWTHYAYLTCLEYQPAPDPGQLGDKIRKIIKELEEILHEHP